MTMDQLISQYGYVAIVFGMFIEGEVVLIIAGFFVHQGYLSLPLVLCCAFLGTYTGDQLAYYFGRKKGMKSIEARPSWKAKTQKAFALLKKYRIVLIFAFRFIYGFRFIIPFVIGTSGIRPPTFILLDALSVAVWVSVIGTLGYVFGYSLGLVLNEVKRYELWVVFGVIAVWLFGTAVYFIVQKIRANKKAGNY